ncbi:MAG: aldehyde dehydrogenase family protein, partial [Acidimicrobiia bacterium]
MDTARKEDRTASRAVADLAAHKDEWVALSIPQRLWFLDRIRHRTDFAAGRWVEATSLAKGFNPETGMAAEEWLSGPYGVLAMVGALGMSLARIQKGLTTYKPSWVSALADGRAVVRVMPVEWWEPLLLSGYRLDVRMQEGITPSNLDQHTATFYRTRPVAGSVCAVLGAGNISSIPALDLLYKLYAEGQVVAVKLNPVNDYIGAIFEEIFVDLIERGFVRILYGGSEVGADLIDHDLVDTVHITGSARTHHEIVFGAGPAGAVRRKVSQPLLGKPITSELGGVSPFIVVPGHWSEADLRYQAEHFVTQKLLNGGFNCIAAQVLVSAEGWAHGDRFIKHVHEVLEELPDRPAYYPGADERRGAVASLAATTTVGTSPCTHLLDLDPNQSHPAFESEFFSAAFASTRLPHTDPGEFLDAAVNFANERLDGTLGAVVIAHPRTIAELGQRFFDAVGRLRYGAVGVNVWTAFNFLQ